MSRKRKADRRNAYLVNKKSSDHFRTHGRVIVRPRYNKSKFRCWAGKDSLAWLDDNELEAVFFLDQCMDRLSRMAIAENLSPHIKVLQFPKSLEHAYDNTVLKTVMDFVLNNEKLTSGKVKVYLFTRDEQFILDSGSELVFNEYGFRINFLTMCWTRICIREITEELTRSK